MSAKKTRGRKIQAIKLKDGSTKFINPNRRVTTNKWRKNYLYSKA